MGANLDREKQTYKAAQAWLEANFNLQFAVVKSDFVTGIFTDYQDAALFATQRYHRDHKDGKPFCLIRQIGVETQGVCYRVAAP